MVYTLYLNFIHISVFSAQAYVQMIRNADNFIYIENQYFMGSAYAWLSDTDTNCHHIIPAEIAQRIVEKIYAGERFVAYIVIPMFPGGDPTSGTIQVCAMKIEDYSSVYLER